MIRAGTVINASIVGGTGLWEGSRIREQLINALNAWGNVRNLTFDSKLFMSEYTSNVSFTTKYDHSSIEDIRATVAGVYQKIIGARPAVTLTAIDGKGTGETEQRAGGQFASPVPDMLAGVKDLIPDASTVVMWLAILAVGYAVIANAPALGRMAARVK
jgi:hypothetical protein